MKLNVIIHVKYDVKCHCKLHMKLKSLYITHMKLNVIIHYTYEVKVDGVSKL